MVLNRPPSEFGDKEAWREWHVRNGWRFVPLDRPDALPGEGCWYPPPGWAVAGESHPVTVATRVTVDIKERIDAARNGVPLGVWLRNLIERSVPAGHKERPVPGSPPAAETSPGD